MNACHYILAVASLALMGCSSGQQPASVDPGNDACASCRMTVSDVRFAAQIVAPGEEPRFFDDIGCLRDYLARSTEKGVAPLNPEAVAYVADHRTKAWIVAVQAIYVRNEQVETPMGSHLLAFADTASRDADRDGRGTRLGAVDVFGAPGPPAAVK